MSNLFKSVAGAGIAAAISATVAAMSWTGGSSKAVAPERAAPDNPLIGFWYVDTYAHDSALPGVHITGTIQYDDTGESSVHGKMLFTVNETEIEYLYTTTGTWRVEDDMLVETTDRMESHVSAINGASPEGQERGLPKLEDMFPLGRKQYSKILSSSESRLKLKLQSSGEEITFQRAKRHMDY